MCIIPGYGGQKFIESTPSRVKELNDIRKQTNTHFLISVDGGINEESIRKFGKNELDIAISGSYICNSTNYNERINKLKNNE